MDAVQSIGAAVEIVSSMVGAVTALEQAARDLHEAPKRIRVLEEFTSELDSIVRRMRQKHAHKLHSTILEGHLQSLIGLIERLHLNLSKARGVVAKSKTNKIAMVFWNSMVGDPLGKLIELIKSDLNCWLELQNLKEDIGKAIDTLADSVPLLLKVNGDQDYPVSTKCQDVRRLLEKDFHKVILIVGLSGMGKSCLARQVASDPPPQFVDGAVEIGFGQWCSRAACRGSKVEYHKRLAKKISRFLFRIGFLNKIIEEANDDLEDLCYLLQTALVGKSILILLDDIWEQDIVERFSKLYDNNCKYLVTTRNEAVYEISEAEKVEITKDDIKEISREILLYHSMLSNDELLSVAESLLDRCGHHPLTVAVMGKALRKEARAEKWERAICDLSTYASCAPGPVSYVNEKESENALTIFGSFEFSLEVMPAESRKLFVALAAISWAEPIPEACVEALWSVLGPESLFPLIVCKLVEGSLLIKIDFHLLYHVHDMVALYLESKSNLAIQHLVLDSTLDCVASVSPWLYVFGKEKVQMISEEKIKSFLTVSCEKQAVITLEASNQALMASKSISEFEASRKNFSRILGPRVAELISTGSQVAIIAASKAITVIFNEEDYSENVHYLNHAGVIDCLINVLTHCEDSLTQTIITTVLAKLAEHGCPETANKVLQSLPLDQIADLLTPSAVEWHESIFTILMSLTRAGKSRAVEMFIASGIDKKLVQLLGCSSEVSQQNAIIILKTFYELGPQLDQGFLGPGTLNLLPWHARLRLERYVVSDKGIMSSQKSLPFKDLVNMVVGGDDKQAIDAMHNLVPIFDRASEPQIRDMILQSGLIERLAFLLQHGGSDRNQERSETAFLLMKLACTGGEPFVHKFLELDVILELVKMMQFNVEELQDSAYTALHQIIFGRGGNLVMNRFLQMGIIERLTRSLDSKLLKTKELSMLLVVDLVEVGTKTCIERMLSLQVVEKLVSIEKQGGSFHGTVVRLMKALNMCKSLSAAERRVMKQQVVRKVREAVKGHKIETRLIAEVEGCTSEGSRGSSSSGKHKR